MARPLQGAFTFVDLFTAIETFIERTCWSHWETLWLDWSLFLDRETLKQSVSSVEVSFGWMLSLSI